MKWKLLSLLVAFMAITLSNTVIAQENDDMYFSRKDRKSVYASTSYTSHSSANENSEYASNHNFYSSTLQSTTAGSPTVQSNAQEDADNNQYFIKDYSIKNKTDNEVKTYSGINSNNAFQSGFNIMLSFGSFYSSPYGRRYGYYNPYNDPFSPYYDPFYRYSSSNYYASYRYDPWRYNRDYGYGYNSSYYNGYYGSSNVCVTSSYSNNVRNEVKYRNGRKIISGSRTSRSIQRGTEYSNSGRAVINPGSKTPISGRSSNRGTKNNKYRIYTGDSQNSGTNKSKTNRSNSYFKSNSSNSNKSNVNRSSNNYRSSGSSSGSRSSYSSGSRSSGSRSSGSSSRSSSGSSRSSGKRGN